MGQLEKYGLYVLCLVIFLILGVAIWGGDPNTVLAGQNGTLANGDKAPVVKRNLKTDADELDVSLLQPVKREAGAVDKGKDGDKTKDSKLGKDAKVEPAPLTDKDGEPRKHKVVKDDTLESIASKELGDRSLVAEIEKRNKGVNPKNLKIGTELVLPSKKEVEALKAPAAKSSKPEAKPAVAGKDAGKDAATRTYKVKDGDTFTSIAQQQLKDKDGKRVHELLDLNKSVDPRRLHAGMEIKLPAQ
jgi:LysM repeat protein